MAEQKQKHHIIPLYWQLSCQRLLNRRLSKPHKFHQRQLKSHHLLVSQTILQSQPQLELIQVLHLCINEILRQLSPPEFWTKTSKSPQYAPHAYIMPGYIQGNTQDPIPTFQHCADKKPNPLHTQSIMGTFLYYSDINPCIKSALNEIASQQSAPTKYTKAKKFSYIT